MPNPLALIGYSGHAYVVFEIFFSQGQTVSAYADAEEKKTNPYQLKWLGSERQQEAIEKLKAHTYFVAIGDNAARRNATEYLVPLLGHPETALHKSTIISGSIQAGVGNMYAAGVVISAQVKLGNGVICNTGCIIEHECVVGDYAHIGPGAVLCGNVHIGNNTLVGAGAVVKPGIRIGANVIIGTGATVVKDVADNTTIVGNPQRIL